MAASKATSCAPNAGYVRLLIDSSAPPDTDPRLAISAAEAAHLLSCTEQTLRRYAKKRPDRLTKVPWGNHRIRYRMDQVQELAKTGLI